MIRVLIILTIVSCTVAKKLEVVHEWKYVDFCWESKEQRKSAIADGRYNYSQIYTIDVEKVKDGRIFVSTRSSGRLGSPASLTTVSNEKGPGGPLLRPYPDWSWHYPRDCKHIISAVRMAVDECNRLWVIDSGQIANEQVCLPQILCFDLATDKLVERIVIPQKLTVDPETGNLGLFVAITVENEGRNCEKTWVYVGDTWIGVLLISDLSDLWRIKSSVFGPDLNATNVTIAGQSYTTTNGIIGLSVSPGKTSDDRRLFFRSLASFKERSFAVNDLHESKTNSDHLKYSTSKYTLPSQGTAEAFSQDGTLFFGLTAEIAIACWNINNPADDKHLDIVAQDDATLQFASGVKVRRNPHEPYEEQLWVTTDRLQKSLTGTRNFKEINFRILKGSVESLVKGTKCQVCSH